MTTSPPGKGCCWLMLYFNEARLPLVSLFTYSGSICECFAFLTLILKTIIMLYKHYCWLMNLVFLIYLFTYLLSFFVLYLFINHRQHCVFVVRAFVKESVFDVCVWFRSGYACACVYSYLSPINEMWLIWNHLIFLPFFSYDELQTIIKTMRNHKKIKDMASVLTGKGFKVSSYGMFSFWIMG